MREILPGIVAVASKLLAMTTEGAHQELEIFGWNDRCLALWSTAPKGTTPGRVLRADRGRVMVATGHAVESVTSSTAGWPGHRDQERSPTTGDWVAIHRPDGDSVPVVAGVLPRRSAIARIDALGRAEQVLAANIDTVFVVHGLDRPIKPARLERSLVLAWESGATPVLVATKADVIDPDAAAGAIAELRRLAGSTPVELVSAVDLVGMEGLRAYLEGNATVALLGESGAGKSTLANALIGDEVQATGAVRSGDAKGRHTTVTRDLLPVPGGGVLIDTPGLRSLGLWDAGDGLALAYEDIDTAASDCKFNDCRHQTEPGCAVRVAVDAGTIDAERFERYLTLRDEADAADTRRADIALREKKRARSGRPK